MRMDCHCHSYHCHSSVNSDSLRTLFMACCLAEPLQGHCRLAPGREQGLTRAVEALLQSRV